MTDMTEPVFTRSKRDNLWVGMIFGSLFVSLIGGVVIGSSFDLPFVALAFGLVSLVGLLISVRQLFKNGSKHLDDLTVFLNEHHRTRSMFHAAEAEALLSGAEVEKDGKLWSLWSTAIQVPDDTDPALWTLSANQLHEFSPRYAAGRPLGELSRIYRIDYGRTYRIQTRLAQTRR